MTEEVKGATKRRPRKTKRHPLYHPYTSMMTRCFNPNNEKYPIYGGRGITVCDRWRYGDGARSGLECFILDMGSRPTPAHTLDRIETDGNYEPGNCQWATSKEQARNRRITLKVMWRGEEVVLAELCEQFAVEYRLVWRRLFLLHWDIEEAVSEPKSFLGRVYR